MNEWYGFTKSGNVYCRRPHSVHVLSHDCNRNSQVDFYAVLHRIRWRTWSAYIKYGGNF